MKYLVKFCGKQYKAEKLLSQCKNSYQVDTWVLEGYRFTPRNDMVKVIRELKS